MEDARKPRAIGLDLVISPGHRARLGASSRRRTGRLGDVFAPVEPAAAQPAEPGARYMASAWAAVAPRAASGQTIMRGRRAIGRLRAAGLQHAVIAFVPTFDSFRLLSVFAHDVLRALRA
jgi:hypothetical protein